MGNNMFLLPLPPSSMHSSLSNPHSPFLACALELFINDVEGQSSEY